MARKVYMFAFFAIIVCLVTVYQYFFVNNRFHFGQQGHRFVRKWFFSHQINQSSSYELGVKISPQPDKPTTSSTIHHLHQTFTAIDRKNEAGALFPGRFAPTTTVGKESTSVSAADKQNPPADVPITTREPAKDATVNLNAVDSTTTTAEYRRHNGLETPTDILSTSKVISSNLGRVMLRSNSNESRSADSKSAAAVSNQFPAVGKGESSHSHSRNRSSTLLLLSGTSPSPLSGTDTLLLSKSIVPVFSGTNTTMLSTGMTTLSSLDLQTSPLKETKKSPLSEIHILGNGIMKFRGEVSCEPLFPAVFLYNRIFKTGSTSISSYLKLATQNASVHLKEGTTEDWYKTGDPYPYPDNIEKHAWISGRMVYIAHFFFRSDMKIKRPHTYMNILRDPVERVVSHYKYMRNEKLRPRSRIRALKTSGQWNESLVECVARQHRGCEDNVMTQFLCGTQDYCKTGSKKALKRAKYNMRTYYGAIGTLENIGIFLRILRKRFPTIFTEDFALTHDKRNSNKNRTSVVNDTIKDIIKSRNKADLALYKYAVKLHKKQAKACGF